MNGKKYQLVALCVAMLLVSVTSVNVLGCSGTFEGDIELNPVSCHYFASIYKDTTCNCPTGKKEFDMSQNLGAGRSGDILNINRRWPWGQIPYQFHSSCNSKTRNAVYAAANYYAAKTSCRMIPRNGQSYYIEFFKGNGCYTYAGRQAGANRVSLGNGCGYSYIVQHEVMHDLGFLHEQARPDRDNHIDIYWNNIKAGRASQFTKLSTSAYHNQGTHYDLKSVMHYSEKAFSKNGHKTIQAKYKYSYMTGWWLWRKRVYPSLGNNKGLTGTDVTEINHMYRREVCERRIIHIYHTILCRAPDAGGLRWWVNWCVAHHKHHDPATISYHFRRSAEYRTRIKKEDNECGTAYHYSACQLARGRYLQYFDRQRVGHGPSTFLRGFSLIGCQHHAYMRMRFALTKGAYHCYNSWKSCQIVDNKNLEYLDRHPLSCPGDRAIHSFHMTRHGCGSHHLRMVVRCCRGIQLHKCRTGYTSCQLSRGRKLEYLDRQHVMCHFNEALTYWRLMPNGCSGTKQRVYYKCCKRNGVLAVAAADAENAVAPEEDVIDKTPYVEVDDMGIDEDAVVDEVAPNAEATADDIHKFTHDEMTASELEVQIPTLATDDTHTTIEEWEKLAADTPASDTAQGFELDDEGDVVDDDDADKDVVFGNDEVEAAVLAAKPTTHSTPPNHFVLFGAAAVIAVAVFVFAYRRMMKKRRAANVDEEAPLLTVTG